MVAIDTSSEWKSNSVKENLVDGNTDTFWNSAATATNVPEFITVELGATGKIVSKIRVRSNKRKRFPKGFKLQISTNDIDIEYETLLSFSDFSADRKMWYDFDVVPTMGRFVRILITQKSVVKGKYWAQIAEMEVFESIDVAGTIKYSWLAPADDAGNGTESVVSYDLRIMKTDVPFDYDAATTVTGEPTPGVFGTQESILVQNLDGETEYAAALTSIDNAGNRSALSNVFVIPTQGIRPGPITGLQVVVAEATGTSIRLQWIEPADDVDDISSGLVDHHDVRCSTSPIPDLATFEALPTLGGPAPVQPGNSQIFDVPNLANETNYHCGVMAFDDAGLSSDFGTTVQGSTLDTIAPNQVSSLQGSFKLSGLPVVAVEVSSARKRAPKENAIDGDFNTHWSSLATGSPTTQFFKLDFGAVVDLSLVSLRSDAKGGDRFPSDFTIRVSTNDIDYVIVHEEVDFPSSGSTTYDFPFDATLGRYVKIEVTDIKSSSVQYRVQIAEIEAFGPSGPTVQATLTWLATGDDGDEDTATSYEIRHDTAEITEANFNDATLPPGVPPVPQAPGSLETFVIGSGLTPGTMTWFAVKTTDNAGNSSITVISAVIPSP